MPNKCTPHQVPEEDRLIDARYIVSTGLYRSPAAVYNAEALGNIPKSFKVGPGARRWKLSTWRVFVAKLEQDANAAA
ncbi:hypothetical protein FNL56_21555 [Tardiphaga sp. vice304]|uniref:helix-turn-helix transcriptional regulator n=1 Tax=Tardiphaga sp. vice304 TaxID=2592817 RepID=UPI0011620103|nr:hypothetical protein [Tardiphaga sp. vice304]QDM28410.1 hypothetical protein FNL56_21555 [Tardiphaga sp. vice304]